MSTEGIVDLYFNKLQADKRPGYVLAKFYCELFCIPFAPGLVGQLSRLIKIYGDNIVFYSILDMATSDLTDQTYVYAYLNKICKSNFEKRANSIVKDLGPLAESQQAKVRELKNKPMTIRSPFDD